MLKDKQDDVLNKDTTMDNVQKRNICNILGGHTAKYFRIYVCNFWNKTERQTKLLFMQIFQLFQMTIFESPGLQRPIFSEY
jgi:hypothetical protein